MSLNKNNKQHIHNRCKIYNEYYDPAKISLINPEKERFIYGNNTLNKGQGGQAIIRDCAASFGIVTKRLPSQSANSFFSDCETDRLLVEQDILKLERLLQENKDLIVYFPEHGIGTGLSEMPTRCPKLFDEMNEIIYERFGIDYRIKE